MVCNPGPKTILTEAEESQLAGWVTEMAKIGYGRTVQELLLIVRKILDEDGRPNPFKDNKPGRSWMKGFFKRHPNISKRVGASWKGKGCFD